MVWPTSRFSCTTMAGQPTAGWTPPPPRRSRSPSRPSTTRRTSRGGPTKPWRRTPARTPAPAGPPDEARQNVTFIVSHSNNGLISVQPAVASAGTLTYSPAADANGSATVTVQAKDSGGTANGGVDTSAAQTFTIVVTEVNDP